MRDEIDAFLGERVERIIRSHHRRRLKRIGWEHALDALQGTWASGPPEPREGNDVEILVDGEAALPAIARAVAGARSTVHLAGWYFSPHFQLEERGASLRELLAEAAERVDVRMLAWAGAPLPLFHPDRKEVRQTFELLAGGTRIRYALDARERRSSTRRCPAARRRSRPGSCRSWSAVTARHSSVSCPRSRRSGRR